MITYKHHLWAGGDAYLNLEDGVTSKIRIQKISDNGVLANLDHDMPVADLMAMDLSGLQAIFDKLIDADEARDSAERDRRAILVPAKNGTVDTLIKSVTVKARVGAELPPLHT